MKLRRLSFSLLLPALELAVWMVLVPTNTALFYWQLHEATSHPAGAQAPAGGIAYYLNISPNEVPETALRFATFRSAHLVTAINLPGTLIEALISLPTSWPDSWHPRGLVIESWRAIALPFFCLPFWWFVGRGVDAALGRRQLHWATLLAGTIFCAVLLSLLIGLRFGMSAEERGEMVEWVWSGLIFWTVAFSVFPITWIWRGRYRRVAG